MVNKRDEFYRNMKGKTKRELYSELGFSEKEIDKIYLAQRIFQRIYRARKNVPEVTESAETR